MDRNNKEISIIATMIYNLDSFNWELRLLRGERKGSAFDKENDATKNESIYQIMSGWRRFQMKSGTFVRKWKWQSHVHLTDGTEWTTNYRRERFKQRKKFPLDWASVETVGFLARQRLIAQVHGNIIQLMMIMTTTLTEDVEAVELLLPCWFLLSFLLCTHRSLPSFLILILLN